MRGGGGGKECKEINHKVKHRYLRIKYMQIYVKPIRKTIKVTNNISNKHKVSLH